jgi:hypothetical protein
LSNFIGKPWYLIIRKIRGNSDLFQVLEFLDLCLLTSQVAFVLAFYLHLLFDPVRERHFGGAESFHIRIGELGTFEEPV